jgi:RNA polymerase sigma-70 factor, ECF subfamily
MTSVLADDPTTVTDTELILKCQRGDHSSFRHLYQRYQQRVRSTLYQLCGSEVLDDLIQDVFFKVWKGLPKLRQVSTFSTWLYRITWNVATDQRRQWMQNAKERKSTIDDADPLLNHPSSPDQESPNLMQLHYQDLVQRSLQHLHLEQRIVLILHDLEDIPQKEVAQILQIPVGTVKSRLFNARSTIRKFLEQQGVSL